MSGWQKLNKWPPIGERVIMAFGDKIFYGYFIITSSTDRSYPWVKVVVETEEQIETEWPDYWMKISISE